MIRFDPLWVTMKKKHITTYVLREVHGIDSKTVRKLRDNKTVTTGTLNRLCTILQCTLEEIVEFVPDEPPNEM